MRFSFGWLRQFLALDLTPEELAKHLLLLGFEVSDARRLGPGFEGVVVGKILSVDKHPNADRLSLCRVTDGRDDLSIVCGATNAAAGAKVCVARLGARLPGGRSIERATIRGVESQGMICSASELGLSRPDDGGILLLPPDTPVGEDAAGLFGEGDTALEVEITPNRPDCLSHLGLARELGVHFMKDVLLPAVEPIAPASEVPRREVRIEARGACRRYLGREFSRLRLGPSPGWMVRRLEAVGLRPINSLVDITNYVLFELGHPLHAFDSEKLRGDVRVRFAEDDERIRALDHRDYALRACDLVVADGSGPAAVAGVIGGESSGVTEKTTRAFLESACFDPAAVRRTSKRLKLRTDSSYRFERGTDPETAALASARASRLILEICGRPSAGELTDAYAEPVEPKPIEVSLSRINEILGAGHPEPKIEESLRRMAARADSSEPGKLLFTPPAFRMDLETVQDLAEEVGRHLGFDLIPAKAGPIDISPAPADPARGMALAMRRKLAAGGFFEACNLDFVSKAQLARCGLDAQKTAVVELANPLSEDWSCLRPTLLPGLLQNAVFNLSHGAQSMRIFELGCAYAWAGHEVEERSCLAGILVGDLPPKPHWRDKPRAADFYDAKGIVEDLLPSAALEAWIAADERPIGNQDAVFFHPKAVMLVSCAKGCAGVFGLLHPNVLKAWDIERPAAAFALNLGLLEAAPRPAGLSTPVSAFPSSSRDLSVMLDDSVPYEAARESLRELANLNLAKIELVDVYKGKGIPAGKKSFTLRLTFCRRDRTLRDEEVESGVEKALLLLRAACGAELRK